MKARQILQKIRRNREAKLNDYKKFIYDSFSIPNQKEWQLRRTEQKIGILTKKEFPSFDSCSSSLEPIASFEQLVARRNTLLSLELPFEVGILSTHQHPEKTSSKKKSAISTDDWFKEKRSSRFPQQNYRYTAQEHLWKSIRPTITHLIYDENGKETRKERPISDEDLIWNEIKDEIFDGIEKLPYAESTKKQCHSDINSMYNRNRESSSVLNEMGVSIEELSKYFLYLEGECLRSSSIDAYRNLIEVKLLFYTGLSPSQLQMLTRSDLIASEKPLHSVIPKGFVKLVHAVYSEKEVLFHRDSKKMNRFINQSSSSKKAGLLRPLSIKSIRATLKYIYFKESFMQKFED